MVRAFSWVFLVIVCLAGISSAQYGGGTGEPDDPYIISDPNHMQAIGANPQDWSKHFLLTEDIDLSRFDGQEGRPSFNRIGTLEQYPFNGTFDGNGKIISNFCYFDNVGCVGLFGYLGPLAIISNLGLVNVTINVSGGCVGAVAGLCLGKVTNCYSTGTISCGSVAGGLIGKLSENDYIAPEVTHSYSEVQVNCLGSMSGGLIGWLLNGKVEHCFASGNVAGTGENTGGLVGQSGYKQWNPHVYINYCFATGNVVGTQNVGGLVGLATRFTYLNECYADADVQGTINVGGLLGKSGEDSYTVSSSNCYSISTVNGTSQVGGLIGLNGDQSHVYYSYAAGFCWNETDVDRGGFIGRNLGTVDFSFWDTMSSGCKNGVGYLYSGSVDLYGKSTAELMAQDTFTSAGWDFNYIWDIDEGSSYPYFAEKPELEINIPYGPSDFIAGTQQSVECTVRNNGTAAVNTPFVIRLYYNVYPEPGWDSLDSSWLLAEYPVNDVLVIGESLVISLPFVSPDNGGYFVRAIVDQADVIGEMNETNNWSDLYRVYCYTPDAYEPDNSADDAIPLVDTVTNRSLPRNDIDWFVFTVVEKSSVHLQVFGNYCLQMYLYAEDATTQLDCNGFCGSYPKINRILNPGNYYVKLQPYYSTTYDIYNYSLVLSQSPALPDLVVSETQSHDVYFPRLEPLWFMKVQYCNQDGQDIPGETGIDCRVYYSANYYIDWNTLGTEAIVGSYHYSLPLAAGSVSDEFLIPLSIPAGIDRGYLRIKVDPDNLIVESYEDNNWSELRFFETYTADSYEPDDDSLHATEITTDGSVQTHSIDPEIDQDWFAFDLMELRTVQVTIENAVDIVRLFLYDQSLNQIQYIEFQDHGQLKANLTFGTYYVKFESYWHDATISSYDINIREEDVLPDLSVRNSSSNYIGTNTGLTMALSLDFNNSGNIASTACTGKMFLSTDPECDWDTLPPESVIATANLDGIPAGGSMHYGIPVSVPAAAGMYFFRILVDTDNGVAELQEDNNWSPVIIIAADSKYTYGGGSGTTNDPYLISTAFQMNAIGLISTDWNSHFQLTADIDLGEYTGDLYNLIGNLDNPFRGTFEGDHHTIANFNWHKDQMRAGLWECLYGTVTNLNLDNVNINNVYGGSTGAIAGLCYGEIINCHVSGNIKGDSYIGGIAGMVDSGEINRCSVEGIIEGKNVVGGIAGQLEYSFLRFCISDTMVVADGSNIGGLAGQLYDSSRIDTCFAYGDVASQSDNIGGLVGYIDSNYDRIGWSGAYGNVTGHSNVGGLAGWVNANTTVSACFAVGNVRSTGEYAGGLIGNNEGIVNDCYTLGRVEGCNSVGGLAGRNDGSAQINNCFNNGQIVASGSNIGGVVGYNEGNIDHVFWDNQISGYTTAVGFFDSGSVNANGLTTAEMMNRAVYSAEGWDFSSVWRIDEGVGYPYHYTAPDLTLSVDVSNSFYLPAGGTKEIPFQLNNLANGIVDPGQTFTVRLYRTPVSDNWSIAELLDECVIDGLPLGGLVEGVLHYVSTTGTDTTYYLKLVVDEDNTIPEKDESNNLLYRTMQEYLPDIYEPDDTQEQATVIPTDGTVQVHDLFPPTDVDWYRFDLVEASTVEVRFGKQNSSWWGYMMKVYDHTGNSIYSNDYVSDYSSFSFDLQPDTYYLSFENYYYDYLIKGYMIQVTALPFRADLTGSAYFTTNGEDCLRVSGSADPVALSVNIRNDGKLAASGFMNRIYLSQTAELGGSTQLLAEIPLAGLTAGQMMTTNISLPIPQTSGVYYVILDVDSSKEVPEHDENNGQVVAVLAVDYHYSGGDGTASNPYQIVTAGDLYNLSRLQVDWDKNFALIADIDMGSYDGSSGPAFTPIGFSDDEESFQGTFDGQNHAIRNLFLCDPAGNYNNLALFGHVTAGVIRNLGLVNARITAGEYSEKIGTLVAWCGQQEGVIVDNCYATGEIVVGNSQNKYIGGLIARVNRNSIVENSYSYVQITVANMSYDYEDSVGGLVGWCNGTVRQSYAGGAIDISSYSGGRIGGLLGFAQRYAIITDCYSTGNVTVFIENEAELEDENIRSIGGFIGWNGDWDEGRTAFTGNCYYAGRISSNRSDFVSGFCGHDFATIQSCFWDREMAGVPLDYGNTPGFSTATMQNTAIYRNAGWLFVEDGGPWMIADGLSYPILLDLYFFDGGSGTPADPYQIRSVLSLVAAGQKPDKHFILKADIDLTGYVVDKPIIGDFKARPFTGTFEGSGHVIRNFFLTLPQEDYFGLFGCVSGASAVIRNMGLEDVRIEAPTISFVGALVGILENGTIENCYVKGTVNAWESVGLIAGYNFGGTIRNCYAEGNVEGFWFAGSLCGIIENGTIFNSYASTSLWCLYLPGGIVSYNKQSTVASCFYNSDLAPEALSQAGVSALTSQQLTHQSEFIAQGWDFVGEEINGTEDNWRLCTDGIDSPHLNWQYIQRGDFECPDGVHLEDLVRLTEDWLSTYPDALYGADANGDKVVNFADFVILSDNWLY